MVAYSMTDNYTVIIPTKDQKKYLTDSITSVLNQSIKPTKVIIINDCSKDNTEEECNRIFNINNFKDYKIINNSQSIGPARSRNIGISESNTQYIAFLDSDDFWEKNKIEEQLKIFDQPNFLNLGIVYTSHNFLIDGALKSNYNESQIAKFRGYLYYKLLSGNHISGSCSSVLCDRKVFEECGNFSEDNKNFLIEDWELWLRISKKFNFDFVNKELLTIRIHKDNRSFQERSKIDEVLVRIFNKHRNFRNLSKKTIKKLDDNIFSYQIKSTFVNDYEQSRWFQVILKILKIGMTYIIKLQFKNFYRLCKISFSVFIKFLFKRLKN